MTKTATQLTTAYTTAELEARDTSIDLLPFATSYDPSERYEVGESVTLTSKDGDIFIGHIEDVSDDLLRIYVELD